MIVVTDAGPLIYLAGAGQLELLRTLFRRVVVPHLVYDEVTVAGRGRVGAAEVAASTWLVVEREEADPDLLTFLDEGEASAIPLAERLHATLLVDDASARTIAEARGLAIIGSLGVLLVAKRQGHLAAVGPTLDRMEALGMFVSASLRQRVLQLAGE